LESWLRLPFARPVEELTTAVELLAQAWSAVVSGRPRAAALDVDAAYVI
jgi:hypothetical protein